MSEKTLLILEKSNVSLQGAGQRDGYLIFNGTFGEIGVEIRIIEYMKKNNTYLK